MTNYIYKFDKETCWYKNSCSKYNTLECDSNCLRYMEIHYLMYQSEIPLMRQNPKILVPVKEDINNFEFLKSIKDDIVNFVKNGESLYIFSENFGNGKTTWAIKIMLKYFDEIWAGNGFRCRGVFVSVPGFLTKLKENISRKNETFEQLRIKIAESDLVIWDDIGAVKLGDYDHTNLLAYVDNRLINQKANIYTGNLSDYNGALSMALGKRLASRVWNESSQVRLVGPDWRGFDGSITDY